VGAMMEKLRKACAIDSICSTRSYDCLNFPTTVPKCNYCVL